jgi:RimJ/RimL family protein N-acetyltransferase
MERKDDELSIGTCGLIKRPQLEEVDIRFAMLKTYEKIGYAYEAASAILKDGKENLKLEKVVAIKVVKN